MALIVTGCGSSGPAEPTPNPPSGGPPARPTLVVQTQRAELGASEFALTWTGAGSAYQVSIGSAPGGSDVLVTDVPASPHVWRAPSAGTFYARVAARNSDGSSTTSPEVALVSVDLRDVIDALLFTSGPMADDPDRPVSPLIKWNPWLNGTTVRVLMSSEITDATRQRAQRFLDQFAEVTGHAVTGTIEVTDDPMHQLVFSQVPANTVAVRVLPGFCPGGAAACNTGGPQFINTGGRQEGPTTIGRSLTTLQAADSASIAHELGHAFGIWHLSIPEGTWLPHPIMRGVRNRTTQGPPALEISEMEMRAIALARAAGLWNGSVRQTAVAAGLVNP